MEAAPSTKKASFGKGRDAGLTSGVARQQVRNRGVQRPTTATSSFRGQVAAEELPPKRKESGEAFAERLGRDSRPKAEPGGGGCSFSLASLRNFPEAEAEAGQSTEQQSTIVPGGHDVCSLQTDWLHDHLHPKSAWLTRTLF